jgi:hypothetical protein
MEKVVLAVDLLVFSGAFALFAGRFMAVGMGSDDPAVRRREDEEQIRYLEEYRRRKERIRQIRRERWERILRKIHKK